MRALALRHHEPGGVLLGGYHHQRASVEACAAVLAPSTNFHSHLMRRRADAARRSRSAAFRATRSFRVLVASDRNSSITSRIPDIASRDTRSPVWV